MDIAGIGTEIVECVRVGKMIAQHGELFLRRVYTEYEIRYCQARRRATEHFAAFWAGKESILKCLGAGWYRDLAWTDMEIRSEAAGRFSVLLAGAARDLAQSQRIGNILLALSHCSTHATAYALAVRTG